MSIRALSGSGLSPASPVGNAYVSSLTLSGGVVKNPYTGTGVTITIGTVNGTGPYTSTITLTGTSPAWTSAMVINAALQATAGTGSLGAGTVTVTSVVSSTSVNISSTATMSAGTITDLLIVSYGTGVFSAPASLTANTTLSTNGLTLSPDKINVPYSNIRINAFNANVSGISGTIGTVAGSGAAWTANLTVSDTSVLHVGMKVTSAATGTSAGAVGTGAVIQSITNSTVAVIFSTTTSTAGSSTYSFTDSGGIHWQIYADTLSDTKIVGARQFSIWGYPDKTDDGLNAIGSGSAKITERFFTLSFPTYTETYVNGAYVSSSYTKLAEFASPVSINGRLRLRAPAYTSQGFPTGAPEQGRLTIESETIGSASSLATVSGTTLTTSGAVTGTWAKGQEVRGTGITAGSMVTAVSGPVAGVYTLTLDRASTIATATTLTGTPNIWNIDNYGGLFRIFREDWSTDTLYAGAGVGSTKLVITNAGEVGIGTTTPGALFDVYGGSARFDNGGTNNIVIRDGSIEQHKTAGVAEVAVNYYGYNGGASYTRNFSVYNGAGTLRLFVNGSTGNVGIGTSSPSATLHVVGTIAGALAPRVFIPASAFTPATSTAPAMTQSNGVYIVTFAALDAAYAYIIVPSNYNGANDIKVGVYGAAGTSNALIEYQKNSAPTTSMGTASVTVSSSLTPTLTTWTLISGQTLPAAGNLMQIKISAPTGKTLTLYGVAISFGE